MNLGEFKKMYESQSNQIVSGNVNVSYFRDAIKYADVAFFKKQAGIEDMPNNGLYWQKCQQVTDALTPFIKVLGEDGNPYMQINSNGYAPVPSDYFMYSSLTVPIFSSASGCEMIEKEYECDMLTDEQFVSRITSVRKQPSILKPIVTVRSGKFRFAPKNVLRAKMVYLRAPVTPLFDYILVDGVVTYLPPGALNNGTTAPIGTPSFSREFEWPEKYHIDIYAYVASFLADALKAPGLKQVSEKFKATGS